MEFEITEAIMAEPDPAQITERSGYQPRGRRDVSLPTWRSEQKGLLIPEEEG